MCKISLFLLLIMFSMLVSAQAPVSKPVVVLTQRQIEIASIDKEMDSAQVTGYLRKCIMEISKGKPGNKSVSPLDYFSYASMVKRWIDYRWFIADTGLSRKWLSSIHELLLYMSKMKTYTRAAEISGNTKNNVKYSQAVKYYDLAYERFVKLLEKPVKVSSKVQRKAKLEKVLWQKAMRKKYKIKDKPNMADF